MAQARTRPIVLIADDDPHALSGYVEFLQAAGFEAAGYANGADALAAAQTNLPDVVVTDVSMPALTGFELAEALRSERATRHVPIVGMTAFWNADIQRAARRAGMVTMLLKPCTPSHLLAEVQRALRHGHAVAGALGLEPFEVVDSALPVGLGHSARRHLREPDL